jgi:hypothetical protein
VPVKVFCSYAHADTALREKLGRHLSGLQRNGWISLWHDRLIQPGDDWHGAIDEHLREADIILLLVSADFLASDYCQDIELDMALQRHERKEAVVVPVILRPVDWSATPLSRLQAIPADGRAITLWPDQDEAFTAVARAIRDLISMREAREDSAPPSIQSLASLAAPQERVLDAAMPKRVTLGRAFELLTMIRRAESAGLAALVQVDDDTATLPEDVRSRPFPLQFAVDTAGRPIPTVVRIRVNAPSFDPAVQEKNISVAVSHDSEVCRFLMIPKQTGELTVMVEIFVSRIYQTARSLKVIAEAPAAHAPIVYKLTTMPLFTVSGTAAAAYVASELRSYFPQAKQPPSPSAAVGSSSQALGPTTAQSPAPDEYTRVFSTPNSGPRPERPAVLPPPPAGLKARAPAKHSPPYVPLVIALGVILLITCILILFFTLRM